MDPYVQSSIPESFIDSVFTAAFTDIGLPAGQTRDGTWNVNNWTERAFLVFDTIFLDNRRNKQQVSLICMQGQGSSLEFNV